MTSTDTSDVLRARVSQIAGVLAVPPTAASKLLGLDDDATDASWVPSDVVRNFLTSHSPRKDPAELRGQIHAAFEAARESREAWQSMPLPVLKNRLLALTNGTFHEWDFGWPNLRFIPQAYPDLLDLDLSTPHGSAVYIGAPPDEPVEVIEPTPMAKSASNAVGRRIRQDLWNAIVDYKSGQTYIWDPAIGSAVVAEEAPGAGLLVFPTIDADIVRSWRSDCANRWTQLNGDGDAGAVEAWVDNPRKQVSQRFVESWRSEQKDRVASLIEGFFRKVGLELPSDAFPSSRKTHTELTGRDLMKLAAEVMTDAEVAAIQLPVSVVMRALRQGKYVR